MYRCDLCVAVAPPRSPSARVILERRERRYPFRTKAHPLPKKLRRRFKDPDEYRKDDPGGLGWEIMKEAIACVAYAAAGGGAIPD